jgi:hypothetical protein
VEVLEELLVLEWLVLVLVRVLVVLAVVVVPLLLVAVVPVVALVVLVVLAVLALVVLAPVLELLERLLPLVLEVELELCLLWRSRDAFESVPSTLLPDVSVAGDSPPHAITDMHAATDIDAAIAPQCPRVTTFTRVLFMRDLSLRCFWKSSLAAMDLRTPLRRSPEPRRFEAGEYTDRRSKISRFVLKSNEGAFSRLHIRTRGGV